jgi:hypothetical protein
LLVAAGGFLWTNGEMWLVDWPGLDEECFYGGQRHRQLYLIVKCSLADRGPRVVDMQPAARLAPGRARRSSWRLRGLSVMPTDYEECLACQ